MEQTLSEKDRAALAGADAIWLEHERVEEGRRQSELAEVKCIASEQIYGELMVELSESYTFDYEIVESASGTEQDDGAAWGKTFVSQTRNGGITGDDFAGTVCVPLGDGRFFQFGYSM